MSKEIKSIISFVAGKEEAIKQCALKYRESHTEQEKELWNAVLKECVEDDQHYSGAKREAKRQNKPLAEIDLFDDMIQSENNLFAKLRDNLKEKFLNRFDELVTQDIPKKLNSIREQLINMIEKMRNQKDGNEGDKQKELDNIHSFFKCDGCMTDPIVGVRYHCKVCDDFDFCERCKKEKAHPEHDFEVIPKEDLKSYMYEFCTENIAAVCRTINNFRDQFNVQLMELFFSLGENFKAGGNDEKIEALLKTHCTNYTILKEETITKVQKIHEKVSILVPFITLKWEEKKGLAALISGIEVEKIMKSLLDGYRISLAILLTGCAQLFQAIATTILKKPSQSLVQPLYEGLDILSGLLKNPYDLETKITNYSELALGTSKWQTKFQAFYNTIAQDMKESSENSIQNLRLFLLLGSLIKIEVKDDEKSKELLEKLDVILQKLRSISQL